MWIDFKGNSCPVGGNERVSVQLKGGGVFTGRAGIIDWKKGSEDRNAIVKYKLLGVDESRVGEEIVEVVVKKSRKVKNAK